MLKVLTHDYAYTLLDCIRHTSTSIDILSYVVKFNMYKKSDKALLIFLALKSFPGSPHNIRVILDFPRRYKPNYHCNAFSMRRFKDAHFDVRFLNSGDTLHAKLFILDNRIAIFGSHNLTTKSVVSRYDISLLLDDPSLLTYFADYFNLLWQNSIEA